MRIKPTLSQTPLRPSEIHEELGAYAKRILAREMRRRKITYAELSAKLKVLGVIETPDRINRKVNRQRFSAGFLLVCLKALDVETLDISDLGLSRAGRQARLKDEATSTNKAVC